MLGWAIAVAQLFGDATYVAGMVGQAFVFDGDGDYVKVLRAENLDVGAQLTIDQVLDEMEW